MCKKLKKYPVLTKNALKKCKKCKKTITLSLKMLNEIAKKIVFEY